MARRPKIREIDTRLGKHKIEAGKVITFPKGLIGFEDQRAFTLLQIREESPFLILQSMLKPDLGLLVGDPYIFMPEYSVRIGDAEQALLQVQSADQIAVLVTVTIPHGHPDQTSLNLTGPILINHDARIGVQVPQADIDPPRLMLRLLNKQDNEPEGDAPKVDPPKNVDDANK